MTFCGVPSIRPYWNGCQNPTNGKRLKVLELFAGTRSIGKAFESKGHEVFSVEWDKNFENINLYADILNVSADDNFECQRGRYSIKIWTPGCNLGKSRLYHVQYCRY